MGVTHVATPLSEDNPLVTEEMNTPPVGKVLHHLCISKDDLKFPIKTALAVRDIVTNLPLKVGDEVIIITEDDQAVIEMLAVGFLQRRFNECVQVIVKRSSGSFVIPYITNLKPGEDDNKEGMVDYNYSSGGCSGDCSSCG